MAFVSHVGKVGTGRLSSFTGDDNCEVLAGTGMQTLLSQSSRRQHFLLKMLASFLAGLGLRNCGAAQSQRLMANFSVSLHVPLLGASDPSLCLLCTLDTG